MVTVRAAETTSRVRRTARVPGVEVGEAVELGALLVFDAPQGLQNRAHPDPREPSSRGTE